MAKKAAKTLPVDFGAARKRLDEILAELEQDGGDIDRLAERIREASQLIRLCRERLSSARAEVRAVVAELDAKASSEGSEGAGPAQPAESSQDADLDVDLGGPLGADALGDGSLPF